MQNRLREQGMFGLAEWYRLVPKRAGAAAHNCYSESASLTDPLLFHVIEKKRLLFPKTLCNRCCE